MGEKQRRRQQSGAAPKKESWFKELIKIVLAAVVLAILLKAFVVDSRAIPSTSMLPTIEVGDRIVLSKVSYLGSNEPERGDIIVFKPPAELNEKSDLIKRLIGLPGETIEVKDGQLYIDGIAQDEPYLYAAPNYSYGPVTVPEGHYFVLGDNRNASFDSHAWEEPFLPADDVKGKAVFLYWPLSRLGTLN